MKQLFRRHFLWFSRKMDKDAIGSYAAESSFWIVIAFIPFVMFILTLLQTIRMEGTSLLFRFTELLPAPVGALLRALFAEIQPPSALLSMTAILCVWTASNGTLALIKGLFSVFDVPRRRSFIHMRALAVLYTLALATALTVGLGLFLFAGFLRDRIHLPASLPALLSALTPVFGFMLLAFFFWMLFWAVPKKQVRAHFALTGAVFSAAGWCLFSFFFSIFVENFSNYSTLYGNLAAIIIFMMWLYFCMYIFLIGGEAAMWLQHSTIRADLRKLYHSRRRHKAAQKGQPHGKKTSGR